MSSSRDEISSRQKRVNSKRHFTIDRDHIVPGRVLSRDEILRVNTLLTVKLFYLKERRHLIIKLLDKKLYIFDVKKKKKLFIQLIKKPSFCPILTDYNCSKQVTDGHNTLETNLNFKIKINAVTVDWNYS